MIESIVYGARILGLNSGSQLPALFTGKVLNLSVLQLSHIYIYIYLEIISKLSEQRIKTMSSMK